MGDNYGPAPVRGAQHDKLEMFVGRWHAEGRSFGADTADPWVSDEVTEWHPGKFFVVMREDARIGSSSTLNTHAVWGWDEAAGEYFAHTFENHGHCRRYRVRVDGRAWTLTGTTERARIEFSEDGNRQTVTWEWRPKDDRWVPLCERTNVRVAPR
jgi:hypothetical protein